ncbi:MAG TPA: hypothetical protein VH413_16030 [Verrucomicrobiae bacterium]|jgi:hypothetical protein|nr:hypothetical protein [Verrucomicrobiae bacterium]
MPRFNPLRPNAPVKPQRPQPLPKGDIPRPPVISHSPTLTENNAKDGLELRFPTRPDEPTLAAFHRTAELPAAHQWHWHRKLKYWYARRNDVTRKFAEQLISGNPPGPAPVPNVVKVNFDEQPASQVAKSIPINPPAPGQLPAWRTRFLRNA